MVGAPRENNAGSHRQHSTTASASGNDALVFTREYVQQLAAGDPAAELRFVEHYHGLIRAKVRARVRSSDMVDDIVQETFLRVFATLRQNGKLRDPERLGGFVNGVCNNVLLESFRCMNRTLELPVDFDLAGSLSIETSLLKQEQNRIALEVLNVLPDRDRQLLTEVFRDEADKDAICAKFGVDRGYLRVLVHRGLCRVRMIMRAKSSSS